MVYIFLAEGFEPMEALVPVDILRRAELEVKTVGVKNKLVKGAHNISVVCDINENEIDLNDDLDMIVLPGGMPGTLNLEKSQTVQNAIDFCVKNNKYIAAICAAPSILGHKNLLNNKKATCFPGFEEQLFGANVTGNLIETEGNIITAKGAGVCIDFALELVKVLISEKEARVVKGSLQCQ